MLVGGGGRRGGVCADFGKDNEGSIVEKIGENLKKDKFFAPFLMPTQQRAPVGPSFPVFKKTLKTSVETENGQEHNSQGPLKRTLGPYQ